MYCFHLNVLQYIQKKDPSYKDVKEDTTWSMEKFNDYVNDNYQHTKGIERDWALTALPVWISKHNYHAMQTYNDIFISNAVHLSNDTTFLFAEPYQTDYDVLF